MIDQADFGGKGCRRSDASCREGGFDGGFFGKIIKVCQKRGVFDPQGDSEPFAILTNLPNAVILPV